MFSETHSDSQRADRILASIRREEARPGRGLLKIFFGMAPGVGKTCAMLEAAIQAADKGVQVIIGVAESHGREDTMRLIGRLPRLPMKKMVYRGVEMEEFDLEEALRVKPQLILVDELAHTNVPGMRHRKRYQDVEDLLAAGIDVYTTLNVQHLESRSDTVHDITAAPRAGNRAGFRIGGGGLHPAGGHYSGSAADAPSGGESVQRSPGFRRSGSFFQGVQFDGPPGTGPAHRSGEGGP